MAIEIASSFDMKAQLPIDGRYVVDDLTARDAIDSGVRHEGMQVYVKADETIYHLKGGTGNEHWEKLGTGGGGGSSAPFLGGGSISWKFATYEVTQETPNDGANSSILPTYGSGGVNHALGQVFTVDRAAPLEQVTFQIRRGTVPTSGTMVVDIFELDAGHLPTGSALATSDTVAYSVLTESYAGIEFSFVTPVTLETGKEYAAVIYNNTDQDIDLKNYTDGNFPDGFMGVILNTSGGWVYNIPSGRYFSGFTLTFSGEDYFFSFTEDIKISLPGLTPDDNVIAAASPVFIEDGEFLYVIPNDTAGGDPLELQVTSDAVPAGAIVIAYREGNDLTAFGLRYSSGNHSKVSKPWVNNGATPLFLGGGTASWKSETYTQTKSTDIGDDSGFPAWGFIGADRMAGPLFIPEKDIRVTEFKIYVKYTADDPSSGTFYARIYALDESHKPIGSPLATSNSLGHAEVGSTYAEKTLTFTGGPTLTKGHEYAIVIYNDTNGDITIGEYNENGESIVAYVDQIPSGQDWDVEINASIAGYALTLEGPVPAFNYTDDIKLALPGLSPSDNIIEPPDAPYFLEDGEFLYVVPNDVPGGAALIPQVTTGPIPEDALVVAFRDGDDLVAAGYRMKQGYQAKLGGGSLVLPPVQTDWEDFTPGSAPSNGSVTVAKMRRVGPDGYFRVKIDATNTMTGQAVGACIPSGLTVNKAALVGTQTGEKGRIIVGSWHIADAGVNSYGGALEYREDTGALTMRGLNSTAAPAAVGNGDTVTFNFSLPISGWENSSNIVDAAELVVSPARVRLRSNNQPAIGTSATKITYNAVQEDTHGLYSDGKFTAHKDMVVLIGGLLTTDGETWSASNVVSVSAYVNGSVASVMGIKRFAAGVTQTADVPFMDAIFLNKDDYLEIYAQSSVATNVLNSANTNHVLIQEIVDFSVIAAVTGARKFVVKTLSGDVTSDGAMSDLAVSGLTIGKVYHVGGHLDLRVNQGGSDSSVSVTIACGTDSQVVTTDEGSATVPVDFKFTAKATSISFTASSASANSYIESDNTRITVTECPNEVEVASF